MINKIIFLIIFLIEISVVLAWDVTITATNQLEPIVFGVKKDATVDYDVDIDVYSSTPIQDKVIMSIDNIYAKSYVGINDELKWNVVVGVPVEQATELEWILNDVPSNLDLFLSHNSNKINMKSQNSLQLDGGAYTLVIEAKSKNVVKNNPSSSGSEGALRSSAPKQDVVVQTEPDNKDEDTSLKSENVVKNTKMLRGDIDIQSEETEQTETHKESKKSAFIGISIIISIVVIGLLIYFAINKITKGIKNE